MILQTVMRCYDRWCDQVFVMKGAEQEKALKGMKEMAKIYGFDISRPAKT